MNKEKVKTIGQLVLDVITAVWLVLLSFLGTGCVSAGDNSPVTNQTETDIDVEFPHNGGDSLSVDGYVEEFWRVPDVFGELTSFLL